MRWRGNRKSSNVEDRRGMRASGSGSLSGGSGMLRLLPMVFKLLGFKGTLILAACVGAYGLFTGNLGNLLGGLGLQQDPSVTTPAVQFHETAEEKELVDFVSVILADTEDTWTTLFRQRGKTYQEPRLTLLALSLAALNPSSRFHITDSSPNFDPQRLSITVRILYN